MDENGNAEIVPVFNAKVGHRSITILHTKYITIRQGSGPEKGAYILVSSTVKAASTATVEIALQTECSEVYRFVSSSVVYRGQTLKDKYIAVDVVFLSCNKPQMVRLYMLPTPSSEKFDQLEDELRAKCNQEGRLGDQRINSTILKAFRAPSMQLSEKDMQQHRTSESTDEDKIDWFHKAHLHLPVAGRAIHRDIKCTGRWARGTTHVLHFVFLVLFAHLRNLGPNYEAREAVILALSKTDLASPTAPSMGYFMEIQSENEFYTWLDKTLIHELPFTRPPKSASVLKNAAPSVSSNLGIRINNYLPGPEKLVVQIAAFKTNSTAVQYEEIQAGIDLTKAHNRSQAFHPLHLETLSFPYSFGFAITNFLSPKKMHVAFLPRDQVGARQVVKQLKNDPDFLANAERVAVSFALYNYNSHEFYSYNIGFDIEGSAQLWRSTLNFGSFRHDEGYYISLMTVAVIFIFLSLARLSVACLRPSTLSITKSPFSIVDMATPIVGMIFVLWTMALEVVLFMELDYSMFNTTRNATGKTFNLDYVRIDDNTADMWEGLSLFWYMIWFFGYFNYDDNFNLIPTMIVQSVHMVVATGLMVFVFLFIFTWLGWGWFSTILPWFATLETSFSYVSMMLIPVLPRIRSSTYGQETGAGVSAAFSEYPSTFLYYPNVFEGINTLLAMGFWYIIKVILLTEFVSSMLRYAADRNLVLMRLRSHNYVRRDKGGSLRRRCVSWLNNSCRRKVEMKFRDLLVAEESVLQHSPLVPFETLQASILEMSKVDNNADPLTPAPPSASNAVVKETEGDGDGDADTEEGGGAAEGGGEGDGEEGDEEEGDGGPGKDMATREEELLEMAMDLPGVRLNNTEQVANIYNTLRDREASPVPSYGTLFARNFRCAGNETEELHGANAVLHPDHVLSLSYFMSSCKVAKMDWERLFMDNLTHDKERVKIKQMDLEDRLVDLYRRLMLYKSVFYPDDDDPPNSSHAFFVPNKFAEELGDIDEDTIANAQSDPKGGPAAFGDGDGDSGDGGGGDEPVGASASASASEGMEREEKKYSESKSEAKLGADDGAGAGDDGATAATAGSGDDVGVGDGVGVGDASGADGGDGAPNENFGWKNEKEMMAIFSSVDQTMEKEFNWRQLNRMIEDKTLDELPKQHERARLSARKQKLKEDKKKSSEAIKHERNLFRNKRKQIALQQKREREGGDIELAEFHAGVADTDPTSEPLTEEEARMEQATRQFVHIMEESVVGTPVLTNEVGFLLKQVENASGQLTHSYMVLRADGSVSLMDKGYDFQQWTEGDLEEKNLLLDQFSKQMKLTNLIQQVRPTSTLGVHERSRVQAMLEALQAHWETYGNRKQPKTRGKYRRYSKFIEQETRWNTYSPAQKLAAFKTDPEILVNKRIAVLWTERFYRGTVSRYNPSENTHTIIYDDKQVKRYKLTEQIFHLL